MHDFEFQNPTKIVFGAHRSREAGRRIAKIANSVLLVAGRNSAKRSGLLDRIKGDLEGYGIEVEVLSGVRSNPVLSTVYDGIDMARRYDVDVVVALGGGSVMDTAKAIAAGAAAHHDVWDFFEGVATVCKALPVVTIPTLAASGSEMNGFMVITNNRTGHKLAAGSEHLYPVFSILDPVLTVSVPPDYTAYGAVDAVCHVMESYFNGPAEYTPVTDRIAEGIVRSIVDAVDVCLEEPDNVNARSAIMWASSLALCGLVKTGVGEHPFPVHLLEHAVSALFPVAHGAALAALLPGWMRWKIENGAPGKFVQFGERVWGVSSGDPKHVVDVFSLNPLFDPYHRGSLHSVQPESLWSSELC
jgi:alcohol dehydrogenase YqhD (iron-dependent ADH family)